MIPTHVTPQSDDGTEVDPHAPSDHETVVGTPPNQRPLNLDFTPSSANNLSEHSYFTTQDQNRTTRTLHPIFNSSTSSQPMISKPSLQKNMNPNLTHSQHHLMLNLPSFYQPTHFSLSNLKLNSLLIQASNDSQCNRKEFSTRDYYSTSMSKIITSRGTQEPTLPLATTKRKLQCKGRDATRQPKAD